MNMSKILLIAALIVTAAATGAMAADIAAQPYRKAPVAAPDPGWTGWYGGLNVGGGWSKVDTGYSANDPLSSLLFNVAVPLPANPARFNSSGALGGVQLGYNHQFAKNWLAGVEADFQYSGIRGSSRATFFNGLAATDVTQTMDYFGTVRARLGFLPTDRLLVYATGGFAYAQLNSAASLSVVGSNINANLPVGGIVYSVNCGNGSPNTCYAASSSRLTPGWTAGAGLEYAVLKNWSLKGEYLFAAFHDTLTPTAITVTPGTVASSYSARVSSHLNVVRFGVNYRFGGN